MQKWALFRRGLTRTSDLLYDPQTSGGLLISVEAQYAEAVMEAFEKKRLDTKVSLIGTVTEKSDKLIRLH